MTTPGEWCPNTSGVLSLHLHSASSEGHSHVLLSQMLLGDGPMIRLVNGTGLLLHFFGYEMSSLARSKAVRNTSTANIMRAKSIAEDAAGSRQTPI